MTVDFFRKYISLAFQALIVSGLVYISFGKNFQFALITFILYYAFFSVLMYLANKNQLKIAIHKGRSIEQIDKLTGNEFERYLEAMLSKFGFDVTRTPASGDYGADLILKNKAKTIVVQAKRYKGNVGVKAIQEVQGARSYYKADEAWVITNSYFTAQAKKLAKSCNVQLIEREKLLTYIKSRKKTAKHLLKIKFLVGALSFPEHLSTSSYAFYKEFSYKLIQFRRTFFNSSLLLLAHF